MQAISFRRKAATCRRLARLARQPEVVRALLELAEDFERAAFDGEAARYGAQNHENAQGSAR